MILVIVLVLMGLIFSSCSSLKQPVRPVQKMHKKKRKCDCPEWSYKLKQTDIQIYYEERG